MNPVGWASRPVVALGELGEDVGRIEGEASKGEAVAQRASAARARKERGSDQRQPSEGGAGKEKLERLHGRVGWVERRRIAALE